MRRELLIATILACALLMGCQQKQEEINSEPTERVETPAGEEDLPDLAEETVEPVELSFDDAGAECVVPLVNQQELSLSLRISQDITEGYCKYYYVLTENRTDHEVVEVSLSNLTVNGSISLGKEILEPNWDYTLDDDVTKEILSNKIGSYLLINDISCLESLSGTATIKYESPEREAVSVDFDTVFPTNDFSQYEFHPCMDAVALSQDLISNDIMDIRLVGMGSFGNDYTNGQENLVGILRITNKSKEEQPFSVQDFIINHYGFAQGSSITVGPNQTCFLEFRLTGTNIQKAGIESIESIQLLLAMGETGSRAVYIDGNHTNYSDGKVVDINLESKGESQLPPETGELIYDNHEIKIYLRNCDVSKEGILQNSVSYYLVVDNQTGQHITFNYSNPKCNGIECYKAGALLYRLDASYMSDGFSGQVIPSGCMMPQTVTLYGPDVRIPGTFDCNFDFYTAGAGQLLFSDPVELKCNISWDDN